MLFSDMVNSTIEGLIKEEPVESVSTSALRDLYKELQADAQELIDSLGRKDKYYRIHELAAKIAVTSSALQIIINQSVKFGI